MPPKKKATSSATKALPPTNTTHPCASFLPSVLAPASLPDRPHPASYHTFLSSPFFPSTRSASPPPKKRKKSDEPKLPPPCEGAIEASVVQRKLSAWYDTVKESREMGWRKEVDPAKLSDEERSQRGYEVWVSEIMLQQTQVHTVKGYWKKWMERFPTVQDLATADIEEVNSAWAGLGYYSRAKRLLEGAKTVVNKHDGFLPETAGCLLDIDGIGPYTAGAISSIAFAQRSPLVDGNVQRVLSRLTAFHAPAAGKPTTNFLWALADVLVPAQPKYSSSSSDTSSPHFKRKKSSKKDVLHDVGGPNKPGAWNQALMELGATVCTPKNPKCDECPISEECLGYAEARYLAHRAPSSPSSSPPEEIDIEDLCTLCSPLPFSSFSEARREFNVETYPMAKERVKKKEEETAVCVVEWVEDGKEDEGDEGRKVLLFKRPEKGLLAGLFEFPAIDLPFSASGSTPKSRAKLLDALLPVLLDIPDLSSTLTSSSSPPSSTGVTVLSRTTLPPVKHIYSHKSVTYFAARIVLSSPSLPSLHTSLSAPKSKVKDSDGEVLPQSLPGRGRWVDAGEVKGSNIGGAVGKVWEERERAVKGEPMEEKKGKGKKASTAAGGGGGKKAKGKEQEKGQGSLLGFFGKKGGAGEKVKKEKEVSDDDLVIVEQEEKVVVKEKKVIVEEKKVYKKRRIAPASDEEDEG